MNPITKLRLYRLKTVIAYIVSSWHNSRDLHCLCPTKTRIALFTDLVYCYFRYGHDENDYFSFNLWAKKGNERMNYVSFRRNGSQLRQLFTSDEAYSIFLDKSTFNYKFSDYIHRKWISTKDSSWEQICDFLKQYDKVIIKPVGGACGQDIKILKKNSEDFTQEMVSLKDNINIGREYIIEEVIENCDEIKSIAPGSLNTIRVVTVIDKNRKLHILAVLLRLGNGQSFMDNYHQGGMACPIDIMTGTLTDKGYGMYGKIYTKHPKTNVVFNGLKIPMIDDCLNLVEDLTKVIPEARYVGWDLAITPEGIDLLEGNIPPGEDITQIALGHGFWFQMLKWA